MTASSHHRFSPAAGRDTRALGEKLSWLTLAALALWGAAPIVYLLVRAANLHESLTGGEGLFAADQLQYMAWIRSAGEHGLIADGFDLLSGGHVFLHPMFVLSGLLWRAGLPIALSFLLWLPVAVGVLFIGFRQYIRRLLPAPLPRASALIVALFFVTPADPLVGWTVGSNGLGTLAGELSPSGSLYGYFPIAVTTGLMPLVMLGLGRIIDPARPQSARSPVPYIVATALLGLLIAWLHPWQGATVLLIIAGVLVKARFRRSHWTLLVPAVTTAIPLAYYFALSKIDSAWRTAQLQSPPSRPNVLLLGLALAPLVGLAAVAIRGRRWESDNLILGLWPLSALAVYFLAPEYAPHALEGISLPLTVLAIQGWQRLRWPAWVAAAAMVVATVPGLIFNLQLTHDVAVIDPQGLLIRPDERRALGYLDRTPKAGGVLPSLRISAAVPAYTGRRTWLGHAIWTPDYATRARVATDLFSGRLTGNAARALLQSVGARYILADCEPGFAPTWLGSLLVAEHHFGCVRVYELAVGSNSAQL